MKPFFVGPVQLGDTPLPIYFPNSTYIGLQLHLPIRPKRVPSNSGDVTLEIKTSDVETWDEWQRHEVIFAGEKIGYLGDDKDVNGKQEIHLLTIPKKVFDEAVDGQHVLSIIPGSKIPSWLDDFVVKSISVDGAKISLGW